MSKGKTARLKTNWNTTPFRSVYTSFWKKVQEI